MNRAHVYLIPGFFGFANFGRVRYFAHVGDHLERVMRERGVEPSIHQVPTLPTSSITSRCPTMTFEISPSSFRCASLSACTACFVFSASAVMLLPYP